MIRTLIRSESTCVPPVTAERSPPASRITGADSPVIALSLTEATPSITSPSPGISSPASMITRSPIFSMLAGISSASRASGDRSLRAVNSDLVRRRLSACALPRPSATASAKVAKSTVNHSQAATCPENSDVKPPVTRSRTKNRVTSSATTSVTKITGLRTRRRGWSLAKAALTAGRRIAGSNRAGATGFVDMLISFRRSRPRASQNAR